MDAFRVPFGDNRDDRPRTWPLGHDLLGGKLPRQPDYVRAVLKNQSTETTSRTWATKTRT